MTGDARTRRAAEFYPVPLLRSVRGPAESTIAFAMDPETVRSFAPQLSTGPESYRLFAALVPAGAIPGTGNIVGEIAHGEIRTPDFSLLREWLRSHGMPC